MRTKSINKPTRLAALAIFIIIQFVTVGMAQAGSSLGTNESAYTYEAKLDFRRGEEAVKAKRWNSAITAYSRAIEKDPEYIIARIRKGQALARIGDMEKALATLTAAVFLAPRSYDAVFQRGRVCMHMENYHQALSDMDMALRLAPNSADAHYWRAWSLLKLGKVHDAFRDFDAAHRLNAKYPKPRLVNDKLVQLPT